MKAVIQKGQLMFRQFGDGKSAVIGLVELPRTFVPEEGAAYLIAWDDQMAVHPQKVYALPNEYKGAGVNGWLLANIWQGTRTPGVTMVRFVEEFKQENVWGIVGAQDQDLVPSLKAMSSPDEDLWVTVEQGKPCPIKVNPFPDRGYTLGQIMRAPVWLHDGQLWGLATLDVESREAALRGHRLLVQRSKGELSAEECEKAFRKDEAAWNLVGDRHDKQYASFLAALDEVSPLSIERPMTRIETVERERLSQSVVRRLLKEKSTSSKPQEIKKAKP